MKETLFEQVKWNVKERKKQKEKINFKTYISARNGKKKENLIVRN